MFQNYQTQRCTLSHSSTSQRGETCAVGSSAEIHPAAQQHQLALNSCSSFCRATSSAAPFPLTSLQCSGTAFSCHVVQGLPCDSRPPCIRKQSGKIPVPNPPFRNSIQPQRAPVLQGAPTLFHGHSERLGKKTETLNRGFC